MTVPKHVGIIMDGNRRYAREHLKKEPWKGHEAGKDKLREVLEWCEEIGLQELTLYTFSMQNFNRPELEFKYLMRLFREGIVELFDRQDELVEKDLRIRFVGRTQLLPEDLQDSIADVEERTKNHSKFTLNFAIAYGGREEVTDAVREIATLVAAGELSAEDITEDIVEEHLYLQSEPDMIIRTAGQHRLSNFLIWQANYAELFFVDSYWPAFSKEDFLGCMQEFADRERRFGK